MRRGRKIAFLCLALYVGSYAVLSRIAMSRGNTLGIPGYCFVTPATESAAVLNCACVAIYYPLIAIEDLCGTADPPFFGIPLFRLSDNAGRRSPAFRRL